MVQSISTSVRRMDPMMSLPDAGSLRKVPPTSPLASRMRLRINRVGDSVRLNRLPLWF